MTIKGFYPMYLKGVIINLDSLCEKSIKSLPLASDIECGVVPFISIDGYYFDEGSLNDRVKEYDSSKVYETHEFNTKRIEVTALPLFLAMYERVLLKAYQAQHMQSPTLMFEANVTVVYLQSEFKNSSGKRVYSESYVESIFGDCIKYSALAVKV
ncbi:hypothetical protein ACPV5T_04685 [Vibrio astriarenae]